MKYENIINVTCPSRFKVHLLRNLIDTNKSTINLDKYFWNNIFDIEFFKLFIKEKYLPSRTEDFDKFKFLDDYSFIVSNLESVYSSLKMEDNKVISATDSIFAFRLLDKVLSYYNEFYQRYNLFFWHYDWVKIENIWFDTFLNEKLGFYTDCGFIEDFFGRYLNSFDVKDSIVVLQPFWPHEILWFIIIAQYFKKNNNKVILDWTKMYEQIDLLWFMDNIKSNKHIFNYFDFFIVHEDFWATLSRLKDIINWDSNYDDLENTIYLDSVDNEVKYFEPDKSRWNIKFEYYYKWSYILDKKSYHWRLLPYRCVWSKCTFCVINYRSIHSYDVYAYKVYVNNFIKFIKDNNIYYISFTDDSFLPAAMIYFAQRVLEEWLEIDYTLRTRFTPDFTKENCELLYKSWCRLIWLWLEAASERVNDLMNKWNHTIDLNAKEEIIKNLDDAWITIHIFSIFGFPTETQEEWWMTRDFLVRCSQQYNNFTATPNPFGLKKWAYMADHPEEFWMVIIDRVDYEKSHFSKENFHLKWDTPNHKRYDLKPYIFDVHRWQFLPWVKNINYDGAMAFWRFIDYSSLNYMIKRHNKYLTFQLYGKVNFWLLNLDFDKILDLKFVISKYLQLSKYNVQSKSNIWLYDWVSYEWMEIKKWYEVFIKNYDISKTLRENIGDILWITLFDDNIIEVIKQFIDKKYLILEEHYLKYTNNEQIIKS